MYLHICRWRKASLTTCGSFHCWVMWREVWVLLELPKYIYIFKSLVQCIEFDRFIPTSSVRTAGWFYSCTEPMESVRMDDSDCSMCMQVKNTKDKTVLLKLSLYNTVKQNCCFSKLFGYYNCMTILPVLIQTMWWLFKHYCGRLVSVIYHCMSSQFPALYS